MIHQSSLEWGPHAVLKWGSVYLTQFASCHQFISSIKDFEECASVADKAEVWAKKWKQWNEEPTYKTNFAQLHDFVDNHVRTAIHFSPISFLTSLEVTHVKCLI